MVVSESIETWPLPSKNTRICCAVFLESSAGRPRCCRRGRNGGYTPYHLSRSVYRDSPCRSTVAAALVVMTGRGCNGVLRVDDTIASPRPQPLPLPVGVLWWWGVAPTLHAVPVLLVGQMVKLCRCCRYGHFVEHITAEKLSNPQYITSSARAVNASEILHKIRDTAQPNLSNLCRNLYRARSKMSVNLRKHVFAWFLNRRPLPPCAELT